MITPIRTMSINDICKRKDDLLFSASDIETMSRNTRKKAIDEFAEALKKELRNYDFWKFDVVTQYGVQETNVPRDWIVDEIAEQMKGGGNSEDNV